MLNNFIVDGGWLVIATGHPSNVEYYKEPPTDIPVDQDVFFGPAWMREQSTEKKDILATRVLWIDYDQLEPFPQPTFPPSYIVMSGHGWHLYYLLSRPLSSVDDIETFNQVLIEDIQGADKACWNANRLLRVPGSTNTEHPPAIVEVRRTVDVIFDIKDFDVLSKLGRKDRHKIRTGDRRGYRSRSERDWAVVTALLSAGASDRLIKIIFQHQPVGDKYNDPKTPTTYLDHTIAKARRKTKVTVERGLIQREDGYYDIGRGGNVRLSTFTISPQLLLDGSTYGAEDAIVGDVQAAGHRWSSVTFTRSAFTSVNRLDRETPIAAWQWLGRDDTVRRLLPHLMEQLREKGMPRVIATPTLGLFKRKDVWYFVGDEQTIGPEHIWDSFDAPIAALPVGRERPKLDLNLGDADPDDIVGVVLRLNTPQVIYPMLGWYGATPLKPWLEEQGRRFPVLNVTGTRGSGKTTLIQRVFMPLMGQKEAKSYDAGTTRFVTLALLGGTNAVPVAFSEFRYATVEKFIRFILLAYDTGHDPRGRPDQTTVDYPLSAPFSVDGEDLVVDPAAQERIVAVTLRPQTIEEGSDGFKAYRRFQSLSSTGFAGRYVQWVLWRAVSGELVDILQQASETFNNHYVSRLPDRTRSNLLVSFFGAWLINTFVGLPPPEPIHWTESLSTVYNIDAGRSATMADSFTESVVNTATKGGQWFRWTVDEKGIFRFQLTPAHAWWLGRRRAQGRGALERDAIRSQLIESEYAVPPEVINDVWMYGINLQIAHGMGLDVPNKFQGGLRVKRKRD